MKLHQKERWKIEEAIFDQEEGILSAKTDVEFDALVDEFRNEHEELFQHKYMTDFLTRIFSNVLCPSIVSNGKIKLDSSNNDCEGDYQIN